MSKYVFFIFMFISNINIAQILPFSYDTNDKEGLVSFLNLNSSEIGRRNYEIFGITRTEMLSWRLLNTWIDKLSNHVTWDNSNPKRIIGINFSQQKISGNLNCRNFTNLTILNINNTDITTVNITQNRNLEEFYLEKTKLNSVNLSSNTNLSILDCSDSSLRSIDISRNTNLKKFICSANNFSAINISENKLLEELVCNNNLINTLDISNNTLLKTINCSNNTLTSLNTSNNQLLEILICYNNKISELNTLRNLNLKQLKCNDNLLSSLQVFSNPNMEVLDCKNNKLTISSLPILFSEKVIYTYSPQAIISGNNTPAGRRIDLSKEYRAWTGVTNYEWYDGNNKIELPKRGDGIFIPSFRLIGKKITCKMTNPFFSQFNSSPLTFEVTITSGNLYNEKDKVGLREFLKQNSTISNRKNFHILGLTALDTINWRVSEEWVGKIHNIIWDQSENKRITGIDFSYKRLAGELDCSYFDNLKELNVQYNSLTKINITKNSLLEELICFDNKLTDLDITHNRALKHLNCSDNKITRINTSTNQLLEKLDVSNNKVSNLNIVPNTALWSIKSNNNHLSNLNISRNTNLKEISFINSNLTSLDISKNILLEIINFNDNKISEIDISNNKALTSLSCDNNQISSINTSSNTLLKSLSIDNNQLSNLNVSDNLLLEFLSCNGNFIEILELSKNNNLITLFCYNNLLKSLDLSKNNKIANLSCSNNQIGSLSIDPNSTPIYMNVSNNHLKFSSLLNSPFFNYGNYTYIYFPQKIIDGGEVGVNNSIDLSTEYIFEENTTTFQWYLDNSLIHLNNLRNGVFSIDERFLNKTLICKMQNSSFPSLNLEYKIHIVKGNPILLNHIRLITDTEHKYSIKNTDFTVFVRTNFPQNIKIGLFEGRNNTNFVSRIDVSLNNYSYQCRIPANKYNKGNYVIQPYYEKNGEIIILERPSQAPHLIDKLPLYLEDVITNHKVQKSNNEVTRNLEIKASKDFIHEVEVEEIFRILLLSNTNNTKIGLFSLNGFFIEDLEINRQRNTIQCKASLNVDEGDYIIAPYEKINNKIVMVNRQEGTRWIDRLPIFIQNNPWAFDKFSHKEKSLTNKQTENILKVYPNPSSDFVLINTNENILNIDIIDNNGRIIRTIKNSKNISLQGLNPDIYIIKIKTDNKLYSQKIIKR